jgi:CelD/BcsL family acetyltransferase involved in cellulose biosynthesis
VSRAPISAGCQVQIVEDRETFHSLEPAWSALDGHAEVRPFQEFSWVAAWVSTIGAAGGWRLRVATLWQHGRLVAVLPLCVRRYKGVRLLEWIGARVSDYCDALIHPNLDGQTALSTLWAAVKGRGGFDVARMRHVRNDAKVYDALQALDPWTETLEDAGGVPIVWRSGEEWLQQQSAGMRDRVKYNSRRMTKAGFEVRVWDRPDAHAAIIDTLVAQKRPWLAARGLSSMINEPGGVEFLQAAVAGSARRGELHLSTVQRADHIAACDLAFVRNGIIYSYIASFDPEYAKYSFGRVLTDSLLMWACDSGFRRLDLLLGAYDYKTEYNCTLEPVRTLVFSRGLLGRAALSLYRRKSVRSKA